MIEYSGKTFQSAAEAVTGKICYASRPEAEYTNSAKIILWDGSCRLGDSLLYTAVGFVLPSGIDIEKARYAKKIAEFYRIPAIKIDCDFCDLNLFDTDKIAILDPQAQKLFINPNLETINAYFGARPRKAPYSPTLLLKCPSRSSNVAGEFGGMVVNACPDGVCDEERIYERLCDIADKNTGTRIVATLALDGDDNNFLCAVRAVYRASVWGRFSLLCSAVGTPTEARRCISLVHSAFLQLDTEGREFNGFISKGLVIETPLMLLSKPSHRMLDFFCLDYPKLMYHFTNSKNDDGCEEIAKYMLSFAKNAGIAKIALSTDRELPKSLTSCLYRENVLSEMYVPKALAKADVLF